ncbi:ECF transporter S component [Mesoplasma florum]|uniref:ECF transporter S component n=1 Tax=Mesoplasma florum TaxID=2151 RepID=UPI000D02A13A|nr:ECF transporter S component [Mesoplasma florum]AVN59154.1 ECF transporter S component [Mesoplasma florum]AVN65268.1 ECF transporter S component [Mesoplasma florum]
MKNKEKEYGAYLKDISLNEEEEISKKEHRKEDHYHGVHHFDSKGGHDHIEKDEFKVQLKLKMSRQELIRKMVLTAIFLALTVAVSAFDILFENIQLPIGDQLRIPFRFFDIAFICISIATLGPIFASIIAILNPILHNVIHGMEHGWITMLMEVPQNLLITWMVWIVFNVIFNNSPIHKGENNKKDKIKRFLPIPIMIVLASLIATILFILAWYLQDAVNHEATHAHSIRHGDHDHGESELSDFDHFKFYMSFIVFAWNILRYTIAFSIFSIVEWRMRPINHRYK